MARPRLISDEIVLAAILDAFLTGGEGAVSFRLIAQRTGLSAPALAGRFGTSDAMLQAGLAHGWAQVMADQDRIAAIPRRMGEGRNAGIQSILKECAHPHPALLASSLRRGALAQMAQAWRGAILDQIAARHGDREASEMIFAAWSARQIWDPAGGKGFRLGALLRRLN